MNRGSSRDRVRCKNVHLNDSFGFTCIFLNLLQILFLIKLALIIQLSLNADFMFSQQKQVYKSRHL